jgi:hypothetical protein
MGLGDEHGLAQRPAYFTALGDAQPAADVTPAANRAAVRVTGQHRLVAFGDCDLMRGGGMHLCLPLGLGAFRWGKYLTGWCRLSTPNGEKVGAMEFAEMAMTAINVSL